LAQAQAQLASTLLEHFPPLEAAALALEAASNPSSTSSTQTASTTSNTTPHPTPAADLQQQQPPRHVTHFRYAGLDTSLAPGLDTPALTASYEALGLGPFGGPGTLAISALITQVLKQLPLRLTGYCGLMLAVCEDAVSHQALQQGCACTGVAGGGGGQRHYVEHALQAAPFLLAVPHHTKSLTNTPFHAVAVPPNAGPGSSCC
jgi:hypothetical protein